MLIYRSSLAYMFRNYPAFPLIILLRYIENLGIHIAIHLKERPCMEIHVQRITYADGRCTVYIPPRQHCLPQEIPFKTVKVTLERN